MKRLDRRRGGAWSVDEARRLFLQEKKQNGQISVTGEELDGLHDRLFDIFFDLHYEEMYDRTERLVA